MSIDITDIKAIAYPSETTSCGVISRKQLILSIKNLFKKKDKIHFSSRINYDEDGNIIDLEITIK